MKINITFFEQPIGKFALGVMNAKDIIQIMTTDARKYDPETFEASGGTQRELSPSRVKEISKYATENPNACFPTAIILALPEFSEPNTNPSWKLENDTTLDINDEEREFALLVDGQHRMFGLKKAGEGVYSKFDIPVVFLFEPTLEQQAIIFSIINEKQTQVSYSLVSQLFGVIDRRTPEKIAHNFATAFNSREDSPFFRRVKMLGKKSSNSNNETLSQGTIVRQLLPLLKNTGKNNVLYEFYEQKEDSFALKVLLNYFNAVQEIWPEEWISQEYILAKTVGFTGLMKAFPILFRHIDDGDREFTKDNFKKIFSKVQNALSNTNTKLDSDNFSSSGAGASKLSKIIVDSI